MNLRMVALLLLAFVPGAPLVAHETPIALLEIRETASGDYIADWTYSSSTNMQAPTAVFPPQCTLAKNRLSCGDAGLYGELGIERLGLSYSAAVVRITRVQGEAQSFTLTGAQPSVMLTPDGKLPMAQVLKSYVPLGFEHILLGVDHLLFVLGLMLLVRGTWPLITTITSFTIAHSLTLAAATLGWIGVPERAVNVCIALSIVVVAVEILHARRGGQSWSIEHPWMVAFGFGLLHGLGFASALTDIGLPQANIPAALLFFNVGVELGQIAFVLVVLALHWAHKTLTAELTPRAQMAGRLRYGNARLLLVRGAFSPILLHRYPRCEYKPSLFLHS